MVLIITITGCLGQPPIDNTTPDTPPEPQPPQPPEPPTPDIQLLELTRDTAVANQQQKIQWTTYPINLETKETGINYGFKQGNHLYNAQPSSTGSNGEVRMHETILVMTTPQTVYFEAYMILANGSKINTTEQTYKVLGKEEIRIYQLTTREWEIETFKPLIANVGDTVFLIVQTDDTRHRITIPEYDISVRIPEFQFTEIQFTVDKPGTVEIKGEREEMIALLEVK